AGSLIGGWFGAHYVQRVDSEKVRGVVIAIGIAITGYFFVALGSRWRARIQPVDRRNILHQGTVSALRDSSHDQHRANRVHWMALLDSLPRGPFLSPGCGRSLRRTKHHKA